MSCSLVPNAALGIALVSLLVIVLLLFRINLLLKEILKHLSLRREHPEQFLRKHNRKSLTGHPTDVISEGEGEESSETTSDAAETVKRPLKNTAEEFEKCFLGSDDVDVQNFMQACLEYAKVLQKLGRFTASLVREAHSNISKIDQTYHMDPERFRTMRALLQGELDNGRHKSAPVLDDPSSAIGLLWARRALTFWATLYAALQTESEDSYHCFKKAAEQSYDKTLKPFNGFVSRSSFGMVLKGMPSWNKLKPRFESGEFLLEDMEFWAQTVQKLASIMEKIHDELNLADTRKSL
eukprot:CAMPEP_0177595806 /NCGR_PEP_ID=MMETSP0419_2-20121207/10600_1 /TAXON_ID=582737 /ORGANISM="Tetraselmis sp., Strain GSL018" /LENGTH=294 /DNA_ID=CAMNT_0019087385 /DNA_START=123 /DNA_END=1007 /DNA_ORIENTATION=+